MAITPSLYLKLARQDFQHLPADICDDVLAGVENAESGAHCLVVPDCVPSKYHDRMQKVWTVMAYKILFENATRKYSLIQRHKILQKSL